MTQNLNTLQNLDTKSILAVLKKRYKNNNIYTYSGYTLISINPYKKLDIYDSNVMNAYKSSSRMYKQEERSIKMGGEQKKLIDGKDCNKENINCVNSRDNYNDKTMQLTNEMVEKVGDLCLETNSIANNNIINSNEEYDKLFSSDDNLPCINTETFYPTDEPHIYALASSSLDLLNLYRNVTIIISGDSGSGKSVNFNYLMNYICNDKMCAEINAINTVLEAFGNARTELNNNSSRFGKMLNLYLAENKVVSASVDVYLLEKNRITSGETNFHIFYYMLRYRNMSIKNDYINSLDKEDNNDCDEYMKVIECLKILKIERVDEIENILLGILELGSLKFTKIEDDNYVLESDITQVCTYLKLESKQLNDYLLYTDIKLPKETLRKNNNITIIIKKRDTLARNLYNDLFSYLCKMINKTVNKQTTNTSISLLDIYGFEYFENNGFEQFNINWANEKLQDDYVKRMIFDIERMLVSEGIVSENTTNNSEHNNNEENSRRVKVESLDIHLRTALDDIEGRCKFVDLINESSLFKTNDLLTKVANHCPNITVRHNKFCINHFASKVWYDITDFIEKNNESNLSYSELKSENSIIKSFDYKNTNTVLKSFRMSLDLLFKKLKDSKIFYVRCIKPNTEKINAFNDSYILNQLLVSGVVESVEISKKYDSHYMDIDEFEERYRDIECRKIKYENGHVINETGNGCIVKMGRTRVFMNNESVSELELLRNKYMEMCNTEILKCLRLVYEKYEDRKCDNAIISFFKIINDDEKAELRLRLEEKLLIEKSKKSTNLDKNKSCFDNLSKDEFAFDNKEIGTDMHKRGVYNPDLEKSQRMGMKDSKQMSLQDTNMLTKTLLTLKQGQRSDDIEIRETTRAIDSGRESPFHKYGGNLNMKDIKNLTGETIENRKANNINFKHLNSDNECSNCKILEIKYWHQTAELKAKKKLENEIETYLATIKNLESELEKYRTGEEPKPKPTRSNIDSFKIPLTSPYDVFGCLIEMYIDFCPNPDVHLPQKEVTSLAHVIYQVFIILHAKKHSSFDLTNMFLSQLKDRYVLFEKDLHKLCFILTNLIELKFIIQGDENMHNGYLFDINSIMDESIHILYIHLCESCKESICTVIPEAILECQSLKEFYCKEKLLTRLFRKKKTVTELTNKLHDINYILDINYLHTTYKYELLRYLFATINAVCFNSLIIRHNFLSFYRNLQINNNLNILEQFCHDIEFDGMALLDQLRDVIQLVNMVRAGTCEDKIFEKVKLNRAMVSEIVGKIKEDVKLSIEGNDESKYVNEAKLKIIILNEVVEFKFIAGRYVPSKCVQSILESI